MNNGIHKGLLPTGLQDGLAPAAAHEAAVIERLLSGFAAYGYERVKPPLIEFEEGLLAGPGAALAPQLFRLMDPVSQRMMAVRADMTPQIGRIVSTRLTGQARPLRLCYAGQVLRVKGSQLRPERQFAQAGAELIGADALAADVEIVLMAAEALATLGIAGLSVDIALPQLVPTLCAELGLTPVATAAVRRALDRKDAAALDEAVTASADRALLSALLSTVGAADLALAELRRLDLGASAAAMIERLVGLLASLRDAAPDLRLTIDPGECRGFEYQTGICFTLFARDVRGELGRGGRYTLENGEPATGFTLYLDSVLRGLAPAADAEWVYLPFGTAAADGARLRREGWATVAGLAPDDDVTAAAKRQRCAYVWRNGAVEPLP